MVRCQVAQGQERLAKGEGATLGLVKDQPYAMKEQYPWGEKGYRYVIVTAFQYASILPSRASLAVPYPLLPHPLPHHFVYRSSGFHAGAQAKSCRTCSSGTVRTAE